eukprot:Nitzschia sp. Nitz4//scaffold12_size214221//160354//165484//NITZ4_001523-RA/size214221-snap-gene-0.95-mRNA-1//1//CDS//3329535089//9026//frame0
MERRSPRLQMLREQKKRQHELPSMLRLSLPNVLLRGKHQGSQEEAQPAPSSPEPSYLGDQSRDNEKTPPGHQTSDKPLSPQRVDPPSNNERSFMHAVFGDAMDDWMKSEAEPPTDISVSHRSGTSLYYPPSVASEYDYELESLPVLTKDESFDESYADSYSTEKKEPEENLFVEPESGNVPPTDPSVATSTVNPTEVLTPSHQTQDRADESCDEDIQSNVSSTDECETGTDSDKGQAEMLHSSVCETLVSDEDVDTCSRSTHRTWETFRRLTSSSSHSDTSMEEFEAVFIHDKAYSWVPARVLENRKDYAIVAIDPPEDWEETTALQEESDIPLGQVHSSMKAVLRSDVDRLAAQHSLPVSQLRRVFYDDYPMKELPGQNAGPGKRDMADLIHLHPAAILYNLKERHQLSKPYTRVGDIVIAMNPFSWIQELYDPSMRELYSKCLVWEGNHEKETTASEIAEKQSIYDRLGFEPHVYEVSALTYRGLATTRMDQTIVVTGESGAGKTETVKIVMSHLATVQKTRPEGVPTEHRTAKEIVARVLQSSPIFEAFGNARTTRNSNSSRFGKFTQLQFLLEPQDVAEKCGRKIPYTDLVGSKCTTYLLEKNRVVNHDEGERSFHIFYQLLAAPNEFKEFIWPHLADKSPADFFYTAGEEGDNEADAFAWEETVMAFSVFKFKDESLRGLLQVLAIVLQLGNVTFEQRLVNQEEKTQVSNRDELLSLADLMGLDVSELELAMTTKVLRSNRHDDIYMTLSPQVAQESCSALAKEIYARLFDLLVRKVNNYTAYPSTHLGKGMQCGHISLLDIFGFERFTANRFEQLCINYANERLHQKYVLDNFNDVKEEYEAEGVDLYDFRLVDNSDVIRLFEGNSGILGALNEECLRPRGNAEAFVYKTKLRNKSTRLLDDRFHLKVEFGINHFTGPVQYDATNFVEHNMDKLADGLVECISKSTNEILHDEFNALLSARVDSATSSPGSAARTCAKNTVLQKFQTQLRSLMKAMEGTKTRYIRCIKPNESMIPKVTDHTRTMKQLECSGLMTALTISRESYPSTLTYDLIRQRYACLMMENINRDNKTEFHAAIQRTLATILAPLGRKARDGTRTLPIAFGKSKVFFRAGALDRLEELRATFYGRAAVKVQSVVRMKIVSSYFQNAKLSVRVLQHFTRLCLQRNRFLQTRNASTKIAALARGYQARVMVTRLRREIASMKIQARNASTKIAALTRGHQARVMVVQLRKEKASMKIQAHIRGFAARKECSRAQQKMDETADITTSSAVWSTEPSRTGEKNDESFLQMQYKLAVLQSENMDLKTQVNENNMTRDDLKLKIEEAQNSISTYSSRVKDLISANDSLVREVHRARHDAAALRRKLKATNTEAESQKLARDIDSEKARSALQQQVIELTKALEDSEKQRFSERKKMQEEFTKSEEKHEKQRKILKGELQHAQKSHQDYLTKLMGVLETTQEMHKEEQNQLAIEVSKVRDEKDKQIARLQQEIQALRSKQSGDSSRFGASINQDLLKHHIEDESEQRAMRAARFDGMVQSIRSLVGESCALPSYVADSDMKAVIAQQVRGEKMTKIVDAMNAIYKMEESSQHRSGEASLSLIEEYVMLQDPSRTVKQMRDRVLAMDSEIQRLTKELNDKEHCKRCAIRDSAARRRIQKSLDGR